jgi:PhzF family phenazine biosynthesis protein
MSAFQPVMGKGAMNTDFYVVDAFTNLPFTGNPGCVCLLSEPREDQWMQQVAFEMNLSETAFILKQEQGYSLRWFTPKIETDLCGHATLAAAHMIWEKGLLSKSETINFHTRSGVLTAEKKGELIEMGFPALYARPEDFSPEILSAFNITPVYVGKFEGKQLIEVENEEIVRSLDPDFGKLKRLDERAVIITARSDSQEFDFISRCFAPWVGVNEDPVTGSSHCCLATYWGKRLKKSELRAYQASPRGGTLTMRLDGDRVMLGGQAVTIIKGNLLI